MAKSFRQITNNGEQKNWILSDVTASIEKCRTRSDTTLPPLCTVVEYWWRIFAVSDLQIAYTIIAIVRHGKVKII